MIGPRLLGADEPLIEWDWVGRHTDDIQDRLWQHLSLTVVAAWHASPDVTPVARGERQWADLVVALHPRIANGTAWLFGALFALILYYRLPLHPLHKAIAFGFMAYLLLLTFGLDLLKRSDFAALPIVSYASSLGYTLVVAYWAWAAWRRASRWRRRERNWPACTPRWCASIHRRTRRELACAWR